MYIMTEDSPSYNFDIISENKQNIQIVDITRGIILHITFAVLGVKFNFNNLNV